jgi:hypothetical protein
MRLSRRFLLGAAPAALVAQAIPEILPPIGPSTWGAGTSAALDMAMQPSITAWLQVQAGIMSIAEVRAAEDLPPISFDLKDLLS